MKLMAVNGEDVPTCAICHLMHLGESDSGKTWIPQQPQ